MTDHSSLIATIDAAWEDRADVSTATKGEVRSAVDAALALLDAGGVRVAEPKDGGWQVNQWAKKAVLLSFRLNDNALISGGPGRKRVVGQGAEQVRGLGRGGVPRRWVPRRAGQHRSCGQPYREERHSHAQLRQHRRVRR